ncbi:putative integral membrane protein (Partial match) [Frankia canadensis]|uniref:Putative integral membrane protein (Partial match) n=2 Tax=Frankia canadensis TaxID=1836972 RepID=A0A2I2KWU8_9ACTN|nr:putative integral membrane protein (Partial match) [Frankia canadensis]SOU57425.1 putative integral membrane protein (Partial match) [Frankia canadensis]
MLPHMTTELTERPPSSQARAMLNKVPEITIWFWVIKILCTTVGESFADWINTTLGVGLTNTALIFTAVLAAALFVQMRLRRYVPLAYWLTVVVVSITGTLYTDILTDSQGVPLKVSTTVFAVLLAIVFGIWYARERTLSIHSITSTPREAFYWLAVLVTFALGTAAGDWTLELSGWGPGKSVLLPAALIAIVVVAWRLGGQPVLAFWLAYILTRPLGANIGDWFATPKSEQGLGLGTALTSVIFLVAIGATVLYLTWSKADVIPESEAPDTDVHGAGPSRERLALSLYVVAAIAAGLLLHHTSQIPHTSALAAEEGGGSASNNIQLTPAQAVAHFPAADVASLKTIADDTLKKVNAGDQNGATARIKDLETTWDDDQSKLKPLDSNAWTFLDGRIDDALTALRASNPDPATEKQALTALSTSLGG